MSLYIIFGAKRQKMSNANGDNNNVAGKILPVIFDNKYNQIRHLASARPMTAMLVQDL